MFRYISKLIERWQNRRRQKQAEAQLLALLVKQQKAIDKTLHDLAAIAKDYQ